jgi:hypothetical protein
MMSMGGASDGPRDRDTLALAPGQCHTKLAHHRVLAIRHPNDEFMGIGELGGANDFFP